MTGDICILFLEEKEGQKLLKRVVLVAGVSVLFFSFWKVHMILTEPR